MGYKKGDRVVVEIKDAGTNSLGGGIYYAGNPKGVGIYPIQEKQFLGKLEDFTNPKKIKFSEAEKKEFDELKSFCAAPYVFLTVINSSDYPRLYNRLFKGEQAETVANQVELVKAIENPNLIEVEKEPLYRLNLLHVNGIPAGLVEKPILTIDDTTGAIEFCYSNANCNPRVYFTQEEISNALDASVIQDSLKKFILENLEVAD